MYPLPYLTVHHLAREVEKGFIRKCFCFLVFHFLPSSFLYVGESSPSPSPSSVLLNPYISSPRTQTLPPSMNSIPSHPIPSHLYLINQPLKSPHPYFIYSSHSSLHELPTLHTPYETPQKKVRVRICAVPLHRVQYIRTTTRNRLARPKRFPPCAGSIFYLVCLFVSFLLPATSDLLCGQGAGIRGELEREHDRM